ALVDALVAPAEEAEALEGRQLAGHGLVEAPPGGAEVEERPGRVDGLDRGEDRLGHEDHAGPAAERGVVHRPVGVGGAGAQVVDPHVQPPLAPGPAEQALVDEVLDHLGEDREDVDAHVAPQRSSRPSGGSMTTRPGAWSTTKTTGTRAPESSSRRSAARLSTTASQRPTSRPSVVTTVAPTSSCTQRTSGSSRGSARRVTPRRSSTWSRPSRPSNATSQVSRWGRALRTTRSPRSVCSTEPGCRRS